MMMQKRGLFFTCSSNKTLQSPSVSPQNHSELLYMKADPELRENERGGQRERENGKGLVCTI